MNIHTHHHILCSRFVYIHTFFHRKIMCSCRLAIYLYNIRRASREHRLHHSRVAPSVPIWAEFTFNIGKICPWSIRTVTSHLSLPVVLHRATIIYMHIFAGENGDAVTCTRAHEKIQIDFFAHLVIICTVYCWEKCKNCKVTCTRDFFTSIWFFNWLKYS